MDQLRERLKQSTEGKTREVAALQVDISAKFKLTAGELRSACEQNPDHPFSHVFQRAVSLHPDAKEVTVDRTDLQALLDNREVKTEMKREAADQNTDVMVKEKVVGPPITSSTKATPVPKEKPEKK